jgi:20S proteasome alpha/beta subunit
LGIQTPEGVVLAVERRVSSPLLEVDSVEKIVEIDHHIGCAMSGLMADSRTMIDCARVESQVSYGHRLNQSGSLFFRNYSILFVESLVYL